MASATVNMKSYNNVGYTGDPDFKSGSASYANADNVVIVHDEDPKGATGGASFVSKIAKFLSDFAVPSAIHDAAAFLLLVGIAWVVGYLLTGSECLPGGQIFCLLVLEFGGRLLGYIASWIKLPPMLGMLGVGLAIRNVPYIDVVGKDLDSTLSSFLRQIALAVILIRAGLGLDLPTLIKRKGLVLRLAVCPTVVEATCVGLIAHFVLDFPWAWSFLLGFVVAPVSPAVVVPRLLALREQGYGVEKGIPTIIIASASLDNIVAISLFGVCLGFAMAEGSLVMTIFQGPLEILMGLVAGVLWGGSIGVLFSSDHQKDRDATAIRGALTFFGGILLNLGFRYFDYSGAGALSCLTSGITASTVWRARGVFSSDPDILCWVFYLLWFVFEPLLFGAIGCQIDLSSLESRDVLLGMICIFGGAAIRFLSTFLMASRANLTVKEKLFTGISWAPKATVQAAIGPVALDTVRKLGRTGVDEKLGLQVLTIAVLTILLTAPVGELGVMLSGTKLLEQKKMTSFDKNSHNGGSSEDNNGAEFVNE